MLSKVSPNFRAVAITCALLFAPSIAQAADVREGKLIADQQGNISAQMTGERSQRVKEMHVRVGDRVKKDDLLARLDTEQLDADRLIAERALEEARALVEVAESDVARAQLNYDRRAGLKESPSFNRAAFEDADVALRAAKSSLSNATSTANRREAEVARIDVEIGLAEIKAPYDGVVLDVVTNVGAAVTQKAPDLLMLLDLSKVEIAVEVSQPDAERLKRGQKIEYTLADGKMRTAEFRTVMPQLDKQDPMLVARLKVDSAELPVSVHHQAPVEVHLGP